MDAFEPTATSLHLEVVKDPEALRSLEPEWRELSARVGGAGYAQAFDWTWRGWHCVARPLGRKLHVVIGRSGGRLVLVWPLTVHRHRLWNVARALGSSTSDYGDVLVERGPHAGRWIDAAWQALQTDRAIDAVFLDNVREDAAIAPVVAAQRKGRSHFVPAPFLLPGEWAGWDDYANTLNSKFRRELRRAERRLAELGTVRLVSADSPDLVEETLSWTLAQKSASLECGQQSPHWVDSPLFRNFLHGIAQDALTAGHLVFRRLEVDRQLIASNLCFLHGGRVEGLMSAYDPAFRPYAPGRILLRDILQWCFENRVRNFDFRIGAESYKYEWTKRELMVGSHLLPCSRWGRVYSGLTETPLRGQLGRLRGALAAQAGRWTGAAAR